MNEFDSEQREHVRQSLLDYMRKHGIGVPRLARRIEASDERKPIIPVKTLQRFLSGKMRTTDIYVGFFHAFSEAQSGSHSDPVGALGKAMAAFYKSEKIGSYPGDYEASVRRSRSDDASPLTCSLQIAADDGFCRVVERSSGTRAAIYDGALVCDQKTAVINLQDRMTKAPKQYLLAGGEDRHSGYGTEALFRSGAGPEVVPLSVRLTDQARSPTHKFAARCVLRRA